MSPALLAKRLRKLERAGIIERQPLGNRVDYVLTEAGRELQPVVEALGSWGIRWIGESASRISIRNCCCGTCTATST